MPSGGQQVCWQGFAGVMLMAGGVARCWCVLCMQLGGTGTMRLPQASTCLKAGKGSGVFRDISRSPVQLQEDSVGQGRGLQPAHRSAPHPALGKWQRVRGCQGDTIKAIS